MGITELLKLMIVPISHGLNAIPVLSGIKTRSLINDAIGQADANFANEKRAELLEKSWTTGRTLPGALSKLSNERDTLDIESISTEIHKDKIRQEARYEAQEEFVEQLRAQLISAFNEGNYGAALILIGIIQNYLIIDSEIYRALENTRITSLIELCSLGVSSDKRHEYYEQLSEYVEKNFITCDFYTIFNYGLANLYMLPIAGESKVPLLLKRANKYFDKALTFQRDTDLTLNNLALSLQYSESHAVSREQRIKIIEKAIGYLERAKGIAPENHKVLFNLGDSYVRLAENFSEDHTQQQKFLRLAIQVYSECLGLTKSFSLVINKANALFSLGRIENDGKAREVLFQNAISFYNDAYIIAQSRDEAAFACLKMAHVYDSWRSIEALPQDQKDGLLFSGLRCYVTALEHTPFYAKLQYETAQLLLNIAKFGDHDIPSFKKIVQPQVLNISQAGQKRQKSGRQKQASSAVDQAVVQAMSAIKTNLLDFSYRYCRDAFYLMPENFQAALVYGETNLYWAFLQKKQGRQKKAEAELPSVLQLLDKADELKPHSASYVRACLHTIKGETELCRDKLKEAVSNGGCPPRSQVAREPYFSGYTKDQWFKEILETIPDRPISDIYSTVALL